MDRAGFKSSKGSGCKVVIAAALTSGILKHGKLVDIKYFHISLALALAHAEDLKQAAKQDGIRLTGELVSCSTYTRAK